MISVLLAYGTITRVHTAALIYFLLAGGLTQMPLFNYLGYEFSAFMTIPAALIGGTLTILFSREHRTKPLTRRTWLAVIGDYIVLNLLLLLIPLIVISLNAFVVKNCAFGIGLLYYFLLPVVTVLFSIPLSLVVDALFRRGLLLYFLIIAALLLHILLITFTQPQLFAYNFIVGFFPGITYDETLSDMSMLIVYREFTIIAALMLAAFFFILLKHYSLRQSLRERMRSLRQSFSQDKKLWSVVLFCFAVLGAGHFYRDLLGFEFSETDIQNNLGRRSESQNFVFYYSEESYSINEFRLVKGEAEYHFRKVNDMLRPTVPTKKKIAIYIYPNSAAKLRFIGTSNTNIAKPWKNEIHLTKETFGSSFRHELVHALASPFGFPVINASTHMGLNEGLAVAVDWDEGMFTPHQFAAALQRDKKLRDPSALFSYTGFAVQASAYAYLVSGSFCRYLIDRFGIERFQRAFPNGNFMWSFGESLPSLVKDWQAFLKTVETSDLPAETIESMFLQQSIFYKTCAREIAERNQRAASAMRVKNFILAESEFSESYQNAPTIFALRGLLQSMNARQRWSEVIKQFSDLSPESAAQYNPSILLLVGDAYYLGNQRALSAKMYERVRAMNYSESFNESASLRVQFVSDAVPATVFSTVFYSALSDSERVRVIDSLAGSTNGVSAVRYVSATLADQTQEKSSEGFVSLAETVSSNDLKYFAYVRAARSEFNRNRFESAKKYYWHAKNHVVTEQQSLLLDEKIELCDFLSVEML